MNMRQFTPEHMCASAPKRLYEVKNMGSDILWLVPIHPIGKEKRELHAKTFDMRYAWTWEQALHHVITHQDDLHKLFYYYSWNESAYSKDSLRMTFVTNHDMNAWDGSLFERYGEGTEAAIVLSIVGEGMPLAYNGLEAGSAKRSAL